MSNGTIIEGLAALFRNGCFNNWDAVALSWGSLTSMASTNDFNLSEIWGENHHMYFLVESFFVNLILVALTFGEF